VSTRITSIVALALVLLITPAWAEESSHANHVALATGGAWHGSKSSVFLGADYVYRFENDFGLGAFYESVSGDFDLQAYGLIFGKYFESGWKVAVGPGVEKKIDKDHTLLLFHVSGGYDWHFGNWSVGPVATYDMIEDNSNTVYLGVALGYGF
jgi:hypothetical protein